MGINEILQKSSPLIPKREMSKTEYMKLVDANTELVDKMNDLQERIDKAIELLTDEDYLDNKLDCYNYPKEVVNILKGEDKE